MAALTHEPGAVNPRLGERYQTMFGQTFEAHDLAVIGLLIVLEGVLSIASAGLGCWPSACPSSSKKGADYGLIGASYSG